MAGLAKRITPRVSNLVLRGSRSQRAVRLLEIYLGILQGKGAASAWSREGEAIAVSRAISAREPVVLDIGAAIGDWSELTSAYLARPARFILVEPSPVNWPKLERLRIDGRVDLVRGACSAEEGTGSLKGAFAGAGSASLFDRRDSFIGDARASVFEVPLTTVSRIASDYGLHTIDFLKVDVEGAELDVFRGAAPLFGDRRIKALSFEFGSGQVNSRAFFRDFWDLLTGHGFELSCIAPGGRLIALTAYDEGYEYFRGVTNFLGVLR